MDRFALFMVTPNMNTMLKHCTLLIAILLCGAAGADEPWQRHAGKAGPEGWRCHVIQPDPADHGPDGNRLNRS